MDKSRNHSLALRACVLFVFLLLAPINTHAQSQKVIVVVGAPGETTFGEQFQSWAENWKTAVESAQQENDQLEFVLIGTAENGSDLQALETAITSTPQSTGELWLVMIGHGTDDRTNSKFNLRGLDVSAKQLNEWLKELPCKIIVVNCASASGSFIAKLKGENRIVITSTKSGAQHNFARFGRYLSEAIADPAIDLDKDQQTSLLEAFIAASAQTQEFYVQETRLATELALIDDNGDGKGTPADWFQGTRVIKQAKAGVADGLAANQVFLSRRGAEAQLSEADRKKRDELESQLETLRTKKSSMTEDAYYRALEPILIELANVYQGSDSEGTDSK